MLFLLHLQKHGRHLNSSIKDSKLKKKQKQLHFHSTSLSQCKYRDFIQLHISKPQCQNPLALFMLNKPILNYISNNKHYNKGDLTF